MTALPTPSSATVTRFPSYPNGLVGSAVPPAFVPLNTAPPLDFPSSLWRNPNHGAMLPSQRSALSLARGSTFNMNIGTPTAIKEGVRHGVISRISERSRANGPPIGRNDIGVA